MKMLVLISSLFYIPISFSNPLYDGDFYTPIRIIEIYDRDNRIIVDGLINFAEKQEKISSCVLRYVEKQSKSFTKIEFLDRFLFFFLW